MRGVKKGFIRGPMSDSHKAKIAESNKGRDRPVGAGRPANTPETLWKKVDKRGPDECWPWLGFKNSQGYGRTWIGDVGYYAHRVIYDLVHPGMITLAAPKGGVQVIMHTCDNPPCCNPAHLVCATQRDNVIDKYNKKRGPDFRGVRGGNSKLSEDEVREIRFMKKFATKNALALLFEVSSSTISGCLYGRHYQDID